jgi:hypothetical protein
MSALSASKILIKGSDIPGRVPSLSSLEYRELAVNVADGIIYAKTTDNRVVSFLSTEALESQSINWQNTYTTYSSNSSSYVTTSFINSKYLPLSGGIVDSDIEISDHHKGIILRSPDNSRWRVTVSNNGHLSTTAL